jgi:sulfoxide reductase heme-binding subunit YedZ
MTSNQKNWTVLLGTMLIISVMVLLILQDGGTNDDSISLVLRLTARIAFLAYLLVFVTRPLRQLLRTAPTSSMLKNRRYLGIAFAGVHSIHLALIVAFALDPDNLPPTLVVGGIAYVLLYAMLITSFDGPAKAIGPVAWRRLHKTGLYWIGASFAYQLVKGLQREPDDAGFQVFVVLLTIALGVRIIAYTKRRRA